MYHGIFDSHAHLNDDAFDPDRGALLPRLAAAGVGFVMDVAEDIPSAEKSARLFAGRAGVFRAAGIHPAHAAAVADADLLRLEGLLRQPGVKALGEIGLDYHYDDGPPRAVQQAVFDRQLALAAALALPVIIHSRDAAQDTYELLAKYRPAGVVHCFSGSAEMARQLAALGLYIGFTGVVTYNNARRALEAAAAIPADRLLIETDCPYMAPVPFRGQRCDPSMLSATGERLAALFSLPPQALFDRTRQNACRLFGIDEEKEATL